MLHESRYGQGQLAVHRECRFNSAFFVAALRKKELSHVQRPLFSGGDAVRSWSMQCGGFASPLAARCLRLPC
jgi:hypothetical protein